MNLDTIIAAGLADPTCQPLVKDRLLALRSLLAGSAGDPAGFAFLPIMAWASTGDDLYRLLPLLKDPGLRGRWLLAVALAPLVMAPERVIAGMVDAGWDVEVALMVALRSWPQIPDPPATTGDWWRGMLRGREAGVVARAGTMDAGIFRIYIDLFESEPERLVEPLRIRLQQPLPADYHWGAVMSRLATVKAPAVRNLVDALMSDPRRTAVSRAVDLRALSPTAALTFAPAILAELIAANDRQTIGFLLKDLVARCGPAAVAQVEMALAAVDLRESILASIGDDGQARLGPAAAPLWWALVGDLSLVVSTRAMRWLRRLDGQEPVVLANAVARLVDRAASICRAGGPAGPMDAQHLRHGSTDADLSRGQIESLRGLLEIAVGLPITPAGGPLPSALVGMIDLPLPACRSEAAALLAHAGADLLPVLDRLIAEGDLDRQEGIARALAASATVTEPDLIALVDHLEESARIVVLRRLRELRLARGEAATRAQVLAWRSRPGMTKPKVPGWCGLDELPLPRWHDGTTWTRVDLVHLLQRQALGGDGATCDPEAATLLELMDPASGADLGRILLERWLETGDGRKAVKRWPLAIGGALGDDAVVPRLRRTAEAWIDDRHPAAAEDVVAALAAIDTPAALQALDALRTTYRSRTRMRGRDVGLAADDAFHAAAKRRGLSADALGDLAITDLGFAGGRCRRFEAKGKDVEITSAFSDGQAPSLRFADWNVDCRWLPGAGLAGMLCSCHAPTACLHRVAAVLAWQVRAGQRPAPVLSADGLDAASGAVRTRTQVQAAVIACCADLVRIGLVRATATSAARLRTLAVSAHGCDLPRLERLVAAAADAVQALVRRSPEADDLGCLRRLAMAAALAKALALPTSALVGRHRARFERIHAVELVGAGAELIHTASGWQGCAIIAWDPAATAWCSWSELRPISDATWNPRSRLSSPGPWTGCANPLHAAGHRFRLAEAWRSRARRLSGRESTRYTPIARTTPSDLPPPVMRWRDLAPIARAHLINGLGERDEHGTLVLVQPATWLPAFFDPVRQRLLRPVVDSDGTVIHLLVPQSSATTTLLDAVERMTPDLTKPTLLLARLALADGLGLVLLPIARIDGGGVCPLSLGLAATAVRVSGPSAGSGAVAGASMGTPTSTGGAADDVEPEDSDPDEDRLIASPLASPLDHRLAAATDALLAIAQRGTGGGPATTDLPRLELFLRDAGLVTAAEALATVATAGPDPAVRASAVLAALWTIDLCRQAVTVESALP